MSTRRDVARAAGVSDATVSHVVNGTKYVSDELKLKVTEAIRRLDYRPNIVARGLVTKSTKHVGLLANDITNPHYGNIAQGMEEVAQKNGFMVSLFMAGRDPDYYFDSILQRQMDGLYIATTTRNTFREEHIKKLKEAGMIIVGGNYSDTSAVYFDYYPAINNLVKYLADLGHKRIGFLSGLSITRNPDIRYSSFMESIRKYGLDEDPDLIVDGFYPYDTTHRSGYESMQKLLARETRVTAVFTTNDLMAIGAMKAIKDAGLHINEDISVAGCDDIFLTECVTPSLTTLRTNTQEMGRVAMGLILNGLKEKNPARIKLDVDLIIRGSTGPAKKT